MGNSMVRCCRGANRGRTVRVVVAGLDGAGKTRTASLIAGEPNTVEPPPPTVGFRPLRLRFRGVPVRLHDVGGGPQFRSAWRHYFADAHGLVFVVDSSDRSRVAEGASTLEDTLKHPFIAGKPVLILASKRDIEGAMDDIDLVEKLNIELIVNKYRCPTRVESYTANVPAGNTNKFQLDPGLKKGYEWLLNYIIYHYDDLNLRVQTDIAKEADERQSNNRNETNSNLLPTAFENPNYRVDALPKDNQSEERIIIVREAPNYVAASESDKTNDTDVNLSPLFGNKNEECIKTESVIEIEARGQLRKLSPIVKKKAFLSEDEVILNPNNLEKNPLPSLSKSTPPRSANEIFAQQLKEFKSQENISESHKREASTEADVNKVNQSEILEIMNSPKIISAETFKPENGNRRILPPIKLENHKNSSTNIENNQHSATERAITHQNSLDIVERPKSASESVRMQLEKANGIYNRKLFNLKGIGKTRTSTDENTSLYSFDPDTHGRIGNDSNLPVDVTEAMNS